MNEVDRNLSNIRHLCETHRVESLYLFGSILNDNYNGLSDIDFLVRFQDVDLLKYADNYFDLKFSLEELLNRPVDLLEEQSLNNPYFIEMINESKKLIYGSRDKNLAV
jgi:predicted nucleotidyltransferase